MTLSIPAAAQSIENSQQQVAINVMESSVNVQNAAGAILEIYDLTGVKIMAVRIDSPDKTVNINIPKGCYIFKIGKFVRKISIK